MFLFLTKFKYEWQFLVRLWQKEYLEEKLNQRETKK